MDVSLLSPVQHRSREVQADLALVRSRDALVAASTQLINSVRDMVKSMGERLPRSTTAAVAGKVNLATYSSGVVPTECAQARITHTSNSNDRRSKHVDRISCSSS